MQIKSVFGGRQFIRQLLSIAVPMMLQQLITSVVNLLDNLMVGQLGNYAISGVATVNRFFMIGSFAMMGISSASSIFIAQFYGSENEKAMKQSFRYSIVASLIAFMPFLIAAYLIPGQIIGFFSPDPQLHEAAMQYIFVAALTFIPQAISVAAMNAMRAVGETRLPLTISIVSVLTNALFNYLLIFGHFGFPALGILGAALGTLIARLVELVLVLIVMKRSNFAFGSRVIDLFKIPKRLIATITKKSFPLMVNEIGFSLGLALLYKFYGTRGADVQTAISMAGTTADLFFVLFGGMAAATTVFVSQPLGQNNIEKAKTNAYRILRFAIVLAVVFGVNMFALSWVTPNLYAVSDEIRSTAANFIRIQAFFLWIYMINTECYFILRAGGDMRRTLMLDSGFMILINLPIVAAFAYLTDIPAVFLYMIGQTTDIIKIILSVTLVKKGTWLQNLAAHYEHDNEGEAQLNSEI